MRKFIFTTVVVFTTLSYNLMAQSWESVGNPGFTPSIVGQIPLKIISSVPYVAFADASSGFKVSVMKYENSSWSFVGNQAFTSTGAIYVDLQKKGTDLYLAYISYNAKVVVMKFDGNNWIQIGNDISNAYEQVRLTFVDTTAYVGFINTLKQPVVMRYDGTNWVPPSFVYYGYPSQNVIDLATDGTNLYVAYMEANSGLLSVAKYNGANWTNVGDAGFSMNTVSIVGPRPISLAVNGTTPYIAYTSNDNITAAISVMKFDGTFWIPVGGAIATSAQAYSPFLVFNDTIPYLAFQDFNLSPKKVRLLKFQEYYWEDVVSVGISQGQAQNPSLAFDNDIPYVAYRDDANSSKGTVIKLNNNNTEIQSFEQSAPEIIVYPNPTKNQIHFSDISNVELTNLAGQVLINSKNVKTLDLTNQPKGIYFLTLTNNNGTILQRTKIIKE